MSLEEKEVRHVAKLSAIALTDEEVSSYKKDLGDILDYINRLSSVPTHGVPPTSHVHGVVNAFRDDLIMDSLSTEEVTRIAPDYVAGSFRVPKVI